MDDRRFDGIARSLASEVSRRGFLHRAAAGAAVGLVTALPGIGRVAAACKAEGEVCAVNGDCCASLVCHSGLCSPGCRIDGTFYNEGDLPPGHACQSCRPKLSTRTWSNAPNGQSCDDGNLCTIGDSCRAGACVGQPKICRTPIVRECQKFVCMESTGLCGWTPSTGYCDGKFCYCNH